LTELSVSFHFVVQRVFNFCDVSLANYTVEFVYATDDSTAIYLDTLQ